MTNYEKIKSMSLKEMAEYIYLLGNGREYCYGHCAYQDSENCPNDGGEGCKRGIVEWLESEVEA